MKKFLPYIIILVALVGLFGSAERVSAQSPDGKGTCYDSNDKPTDLTEEQCKLNKGTLTEKAYYWVPAGTTAPTQDCKDDGSNKPCFPTSTTLGTCRTLSFGSDGAATVTVLRTTQSKCTELNKEYPNGSWKVSTIQEFQAEAAALAASQPASTSTVPNSGSDFENEISKNQCSMNPLSETGSFWPGCFIQASYVIFYVIPALLLFVSAYFFNFLISITLSSELFANSEFIPAAWAIVRDLSNIFFILVLLYIAIRMILGLAGHGVKEMIAKVIIAALLINFSMFFTAIVIDSSNILALVFYNKLDVKTTVNGKEREYPDANGEKDVAGGLVAAFNPTSLLTADFFEKAGVQQIPGAPAIKGKVPASMLIGITVIAGLLMGFAAYALFVAGFSFMGRLIELWILIIASPFAFMSSVIPQMSHIGEWGWEAWLKRLLRASFMAPAFMFFMYFIFLLIQSKIFENMIKKEDHDFIETILLIIIPAMMILTLLLKSIKLAKAGSGQFGETIIGGAKLLTGLGIGLASGGAALAGRATLGATAKYVQNEGARKKDLRFGGVTSAASEIKGWNIINPLKYAKLAGSVVASTPKFATAGVAEILHQVGVGKKLKEADEGYAHKTHATHILDAKMKSEFGHDYADNAKFKDLKESEQEIVKAEVEKDEMAKFVYGKLFKDLEAPQAAEIQAKYKGNSSYADPVTGNLVAVTTPQRAIDNGHGKTVGIGDSVTSVLGGKEFKSDYFVRMSKVNSAVGEFVQALRKGSYDVRNLPDMQAKTKGFPKFGVALVAGVAAGVRLGLKKGGGVEYGTPQKDIFKDIGNTITEALKNVKINIGGGGSGGGHDDGHTKEVKSVGH